ncbi:hypothetical protein HA075_08255 [bacterium BFN5]|nr:hypothetical protein HA075_08225 [bacterium BFN5]QJW45840.1 hypothetical protein HA075_08255 [bacterium BFN5]
MPTAPTPPYKPTLPTAPTKPQTTSDAAAASSPAVTQPDSQNHINPQLAETIKEVESIGKAFQTKPTKQDGITSQSSPAPQTSEPAKFPPITSLDSQENLATSTSLPVNKDISPSKLPGSVYVSLLSVVLIVAVALIIFRLMKGKQSTASLQPPPAPPESSPHITTKAASKKTTSKFEIRV